MTCAMLTIVSLAGCTGGDATDDAQIGDDGSDGGGSDGGGSDGSDGGSGGSGTGSGGSGGGSGGSGGSGGGGSGEPETRSANLTADTTSGEVPFTVTFTLDGTGIDGETTWFLAYGDGNNTEGEGSELPKEESYEYQIAGDFTARLVITYGDGEAEDAEVQITATLGEGGEEEEPPETFFEYGPVMGCIGGTDVGQSCVSFQAGPGQPAVDGHWQALDERYWGMNAVALGKGMPLSTDTDCVVTDADHTVLADGHNGPDPCGLVIPEGAAFIYIYPWIEPATEGMTLEFTS